MENNWVEDLFVPSFDAKLYIEQKGSDQEREEENRVARRECMGAISKEELREIYEKAVTFSNTCHEMKSVAEKEGQESPEVNEIPLYKSKDDLWAASEKRTFFQEISCLQRENRVLKFEVHELKAENDLFRVENGRLKKDLEICKQNSFEMENELKRKDAGICFLESQNSELNSKLNSVEKDLEETRLCLEKVNRERNSLRTETVKLETRHQILSKQFEVKEDDAEMRQKDILLQQETFFLAENRNLNKEIQVLKNKLIERSHERQFNNHLMKHVDQFCSVAGTKVTHFKIEDSGPKLNARTESSQQHSKQFLAVVDL